MFRSPAWWSGPLTVSRYCWVSPRLSPWFTYLGFLLFLTSLTNVLISCLVIWASNSSVIVQYHRDCPPDLPTLASYCSWRVWRMFWSPAWWYGPLTVSCYCSVSPRLSPWFTYLGFLLFLTSLTNVLISCLVIWASNSFLLLFSITAIVPLIYLPWLLIVPDEFEECFDLLLGDVSL